MSDYKKEELEKLKDLKTSIEKLEGIAIPFNIINRYIAPLDAWVDEVLCED
jgi:hypothetical protein